MSARTRPTQEGERYRAESFASDATPVNVWNDPARRLVVLGYITAVAIPFIGFILGTVIVIRASKGSSKHGAWIIVLSIVAAIAWILIVASGALKLTPNDLNT